jgi:large subunit ribosomal protein L35
LCLLPRAGFTSRRRQNRVKSEDFSRETVNISEDIMPKLKTNSGAKKRFKITGTGKVKKANGWKSHLLESKKSKRKRKLRKLTIVSKSETTKIKRMLPYA